MIRTLCLLLLLLVPLSAGAQEDDLPITEVLVGLPTTITSLQVTALASTLAATTGTHAVGTLQYRPVARLALDGQDLDATLALLRSDPRITYAEPNYPVRALAAPLDPALYTYQWGFRRSGGPEALGHIRALGAVPLILAVIDTGIDRRHPEVAGRLTKGWDFVGGDAFPQDGHGHGTHVAAIAAATTFNDLGIAAPFPGAIMPVRVLDDTGSGYISDVADGIDFAAAHGAVAINLSLGGTISSETLHDAIVAAAARGVVIVAAAGNSGTTTPSYPAAYSEVIAVSAWSWSDNDITSFSTFGPMVELTAPGEKIYSAFLGRGYQILDGTSMASPLVAGTAASVYAELLRSDPAIDRVKAAACVRQILDDSAEDVRQLGRDEHTGFGLVRIDRALDMAETYQCP
ncbi:MAG: S8 family serine peptidase [Nitrospirota bacterium]|jgi:thermitase